VKKIIIVFLFFLAICVWLWKSDKPTPATIPKPNPVSVQPTPTPTPALPEDPRIAHLTSFFEHYKCPSYNFDLISDYLHAADEHNLDYRLLPAISIAESSCGQHACPNNFWGWNSCQDDFFTDPAQGIQYIASKLESGDYYRGKTLEQKLHSYNPNPSYAGKIIGFMKEIEP
jgi:hypothetical protein